MTGLRHTPLPRTVGRMIVHDTDGTSAVMAMRGPSEVKSVPEPAGKHLSPEPPPEPSGEVDESPWVEPPSPGAGLASSPTGPTLLPSPLPELLAPDDPELDAPELPRPELDGPAPELDSPPGRAL